MRTLLLALVAGALVLRVSPSAPGQCQLFSVETGRGDIGHGDPGDIGPPRMVLTDVGQFPFRAKFYAKSPEAWQVQQTSEIEDSLALFFTLPVALDGDRAIVGAPEGNDLTGRAFVFDRIGDRWIRTELVSPTVETYDFFGTTVALDGDVAVIGAEHMVYGGGDGIPRAHVFEFDGASWSEVAQFESLYDAVIDVDGSTIVVGSDVYPGIVRIYEKIGRHWVWVQTLQGTGADPWLGSSVSLHKDVLVVGAAWPTSAYGCVRVYRREGGTWSEAQSIHPHDSMWGDQFGMSVAFSGSTLLVGAPGAAGSKGKVYRFEYDGTRYIEVGSFGPQISGYGGFGHDVAFEGKDALISEQCHGCYWPDLSVYRLDFVEQRAFCPTTPNSTGVAATLSVEGCDILGGGPLTVVTTSLPAGVLALSFFGEEATQVPLGSGFRCVGPPLFRLPAATASPAGVLHYDVDLHSGPGTRITAGRTWNFQTFYRDPAGPDGTNLSNAFAIEYTP